MALNRGVGYCLNVGCISYGKGTFLINIGDVWNCPACRVRGEVIKERGFYTGRYDTFKEVRVEYNYEPINRRFREIAIVTDDALPHGNIYILQSPMIHADKRALKVAESILGNLNRYARLLEDEIPRTTEILFDLAEPFEKFAKKVQEWGRELLNSESRPRNPLAL